MMFLLRSGLAVSSLGAVGLVMVTASVEAGVVVAGLQGIGAETPISGITIGILGASFIVGLGFLWKGALWMLEMGALLAEWRNAMKEVPRLTQTLHRIEERMAASERWQQEHDPILGELHRKARLRGMRLPAESEEDIA